MVAEVAEELDLFQKYPYKAKSLLPLPGSWEMKFWDLGHLCKKGQKVPRVPQGHFFKVKSGKKIVKKIYKHTISMFFVIHKNIQ